MAKLKDRLDSFVERITGFCREHSLCLDVHGAKGEDKASPITFYTTDARYLLTELVESKNKKWMPAVMGMATIFAETGFIIDRGQYEAGYPMVIRDRKWRKQLAYLYYEYVTEEELISYVWHK